MKANTHYIPQPAPLLSEQSPFSVQEAYRVLRTNVLFSMPGTDCKCVGVTSPNPGDGKSTTAANLAIALGQIGKRVILVDCDMRLPTVAAKFDVPQVPGLSDFLVGECQIEEAVRTNPQWPISLLPAGNLPPDATGLLEAHQLEGLFNGLKMIFDYIIVDLPPVQSVPDAVILSKYIDGYLLAVKERHTRHRAVTETLKQLRIGGARLLGFVTTDGQVRRSRYHYQK